MNRDHIEFVQLRDMPVFHQPKWWDRPRWWLVKVLGGSNPNDTVRIDRIPVHGKTFMDRLYKQKRHLFDRFNCREPQTLLIGGEDYEELMDSPEIRQAITFSASYYHGREGICGLTVKVIPWMRGMVVMP
jgi:hypothetical protein